MAPRPHTQLKRGAMRAACQRSTSKSLTAATASIQMDLAFVGGEGEQTKDLNRVLLAPLPDATTGRISSGRKRDYGAMFRERSERPVGTTQKDAIQKSFFGFSEGFLPPPRCPRRSFAVQTNFDLTPFLRCYSRVSESSTTSEAPSS